MAVFEIVLTSLGFGNKLREVNINCSGDDVYKSWIRAQVKLDFPHDSTPIVKHLRGLGVQSNATLGHHIREAYGHALSAERRLLLIHVHSIGEWAASKTSLVGQSRNSVSNY